MIPDSGFWIPDSCFSRPPFVYDRLAIQQLDYISFPPWATAIGAFFPQKQTVWHRADLSLQIHTAISRVLFPRLIPSPYSEGTNRDAISIFVWVPAPPPRMRAATTLRSNVVSDVKALWKLNFLRVQFPSSSFIWSKNVLL